MNPAWQKRMKERRKFFPEKVMFHLNVVNTQAAKIRSIRGSDLSRCMWRDAVTNPHVSPFLT